MSSSSDPIALQDSGTIRGSHHRQKRGSGQTESSLDELNLGCDSRMQSPGSSAGKTVRYQPYSPPGFFTDMNHDKGLPYGIRFDSLTKAGRITEPAPIPRVSSDVEEEWELARDTSFGSFCAQEDDFVTAIASSERSTAAIRSRKQRPAGSGERQMSSFDQLCLQHPFSDGSWRNSGLALGFGQPVTDGEDFSSSSSVSEEVGKPGRVVTQSWKPPVKESLTTSSSIVTQDENPEDESQGSGSGSGSDVTDTSSEIASSIASFSVKYFHSKVSYQHYPSSSPREPESDSLTAYGVNAPTSFSVDPSYQSHDAIGELNGTSQPGFRSPIIETQSGVKAESTPLTRYAASQTTGSAIDDSFTLHGSYTVKESANKVAPQMDSIRSARSFSGIGGCSTPLTAYQVTQKTTSSRVSLYHKMASSTPLSNYAADRVSSGAATKRRTGCIGLAASRTSSAVEGLGSFSDEASVEHLRQPPSAYADDFMLNDAAELASDPEHSSSSSSSRQIQASLPDSGSQMQSPQSPARHLHVQVQRPDPLIDNAGHQDPPEPVIPTALDPARGRVRRFRKEPTARELKRPITHADEATVSLKHIGSRQPKLTHSSTS